MILPSQEIRKREMIEPFREDQLQPASYDLRLDHAEKDDIMPGEFMLGCTVETVRIPSDLVGELRGKSSIARLGLIVECAGYCDPGFEGQIVLELFNMSNRPIDLTQINTIAQIKFTKLADVPEELYDGHYQNQKGITESWMKDE